jgi:serine phosphatase RsbU (regulator of sigma subunit)
VTVTLDLTIIFLLTRAVTSTTPDIIDLTSTEYALLMTVVFIFFSLLSALRINHTVIYISAALTIIYNVIIYSNINQLMMLGLFVISMFGIIHVFILWVSNYILHYFLLSNKINVAYQDIKFAHNQISQQNEEISSQKEEINNHLTNLEQAYTELSDSIIYAKKIQNALINNSSVLKDNFKDHFVFFKPKSIVSGDFFWGSELDDKIMFALADCTGHGVPGAFMTMLGSSFLNEIINKKKETNPDKALNILRQNIIDNLHQDGKLYQPKDGMDMVLLQIDRKNKEILFSGANNSFCYIPRSMDKENGKIVEFKGDRMPISYHYKMRNYSLLKLSYEPGDRIYLYSDGYIDQFGGDKGKKFKSVPFKRMLYDNHDKPMKEQGKILKNTFESWIRHKYEQIDDITVIGITL